MEQWNRLTEWVIEKIKKDYAQDISLLVAVEGHSTGGDGHGECFDYFVPATDRGYELTRTFIIDKVGHDLYPRSWERVERTARLQEMPPRCMTGAKILYARSREDEIRFAALQQLLADSLANPVYMYGKALERLDEAMDIYRTMMFEEQLYRARTAAGCIQTYLTQAVAFVNGTTADNGVFTKKQAYDTDPSSRIYHCPELTEVPENFFVYGEMILKAGGVEELKHLSYLQIHSCRKFLQSYRPAAEQETAVDYRALAEWYQELSLTWRRIRYFCDRNMAEEAYSDACYLQRELMVVGAEFGLSDMDLLGAYEFGRLKTLKCRSMELEEGMLEILKSHEIELCTYATLDEFLAVNG